MNKLTATICLLYVLLCCHAFGQNFDYEYGKITMDDIHYEHKEDPSVSAVVLFDKGHSDFVINHDYNGYNVRYTRTTKIKILNEGGLDYAEVKVFLYKNKSDYESISDIKGVTYNYENHRVIKSELDVKTVFDQKADKYGTRKVFTLPNVKVGSVIEYTYTIESPFIYYFRNWSFQWYIPTLKSLYVAKMVPFYTYSYILQEIDTLEHSKSYTSTGISRQFGQVTFRDKVYEFGMSNIPAFKSNERFITSEDDYIKKIIFQISQRQNTRGIKSDITATWEDLNKELLKDEKYGFFLKAMERKARSILEENPSLQSGQNERELFNLILDYVKRNYSWNGLYAKFAQQKPAELLKSKTGHSSDLNMLSIGLLRAVGLTAYPMISSTRDNGRIFFGHPFLSFFNNTMGIVEIDKANYFFDATQPLLSNELIPANMINDHGFLIDKEKSAWYPLNSSVVSVNSKKMFLQPNVDSDSVIFRVTDIYSNFYASNKRNLLLDKTENIHKHLRNKGYVLYDEVHTQNYTKPNEPYIFKYKAGKPIETFGKNLIIKPFLSEVPEENYLNDKTRNYPVDFTFLRYKSLNSSIILPQGYRIRSFPENQSIDSDIGSMNYTVELKGRMLVVNATYGFLKSVYPVTDYAELRTFYGTLIKKLNEAVILEPE